MKKPAACPRPGCFGETRHPALAGAGTLLAFAVALGFATGCEDTAPTRPQGRFSPRRIPSDVVSEMVIAHRTRDTERYARLLADDFRFWLNPTTRAEWPIAQESWGRTADSACVGRMLRNPWATEVVMKMTVIGDSADRRPGFSRWRRQEVDLEQLEIVTPGDHLPISAQGRQTFQLRLGRNPADTLDSSPTAHEWFLVEWHDQGRAAMRGSRTTPAFSPQPAQSETWSFLKYFYCQ